MPPRKVEHDGSDHAYRMVIEDRYKRLVAVKRSIQRLTVAAGAYVPLRSLWQCLPLAVAGVPPSTTNLIILGLGALLPLTYMGAFGIRNTQREREGGVKVFGMVIALLLTQLVLAAYQYHMLLPKDELIPALLARRFPAGLLGLDTEQLTLAAQVVEVVLDAAGVAILLPLTLGVKDYVVEKRDQRREAAGKRD